MLSMVTIIFLRVLNYIELTNAGVSLRYVIEFDSLIIDL